MTQLILASSSSARQQLMQRLKLPFITHPADIDESRLVNENIEQYVTRLAQAKAQKVSQQFPKAIVIGCDEVGVNLDLDPQRHLGKPHNHTNAVNFLRGHSGCRLQFLSALCVISPDAMHQTIAKTHIQFRTLSESEIEQYLIKDKPYQCSGAFKSESLGVTLCKSLLEDEPGALMGLPLISLTHYLMDSGLSPLT